MTDPMAAQVGRGQKPSGAMETTAYEPEQRVTETSGGGGAPAAAESYQATAFDKEYNPAGSNQEHGAQIQIGDPMTEGPYPDDLMSVDVSLQQTFTQLMEIRSALRTGVTSNDKSAVEKNLKGKDSYVQQLQAIENNTFKMVFTQGGADRMPAGETMLRTLFEQSKALLSQQYGTELKSNPSLAAKPQDPSKLDGDQLSAKLNEPDDAMTGNQERAADAYGLADGNYKAQ